MRSRETMQAELRRAGLELVRESAADEWVARFGASPLRGETARVTRLAVARKP